MILYSVAHVLDALEKGDNLLSLDYLTLSGNVPSGTGCECAEIDVVDHGQPAFRDKLVVRTVQHAMMADGGVAEMPV